MNALERAKVAADAVRLAGGRVGGYLVGREFFNALCTEMAQRAGTTMIDVHPRGDGPSLDGCPVIFDPLCPSRELHCVSPEFVEQWERLRPPDTEVLTRLT